MNKYLKYKNKYLSLKKIKGGSLQDLPFQYEQCVICLEEIKQDDTVRICYAANHIFHTACINQHLQTKHNCPLCNNIQFIDPVLRARAQEARQRDVEARQRERQRDVEARERQREIEDVQRLVQDEINRLLQPTRTSPAMSRIEAINFLIVKADERAQAQQGLWGYVHRSTLLELDELRRVLENQT